MTTCPYGSSAQTGQPTYFWLTSDDVYNWLTATNGSKLFPLVEGIQPQLLTVADFCTQDYPEPPSISDAQVVLALTNPLSYILLQQQLIAGAKSYAWSQRCQCLGSGGGGICSPTIGPIATSVPNSYQMTSFVVPPGSTSMSGSYVVNYASGQNEFWFFIGTIPHSGALAVGQPFPSGNLFGWHGPLSDFPKTWGPIAVTPGQTLYFHFSGRATGPQGSAVLSFAGCGGPYTVPAPPAPSLPDTPDYPIPTGCTTDDLCKQLAELKANQNINNTYTQLIQRQAVPFAYLSGTPFPISGQGTHAVQGILGLKLSLTDSRSGVGNYPDNPTTYYDLGWLSVGTADGYQRSQQIRHRQELIFDVSPVVTTVSWSLPSGVSGTCTPLVREP